MIKRGELLITMLTGLALFSQQAQFGTYVPKRLAIYYGYPSVVNGAAGEVEKAISVFRKYDLVVLGDGVEFADSVAGRYPTGVGADEHEKTRKIIAALAGRGSSSKVFGYICLGDSQHLTESEIRRRVQLWKEMGVSGIFLDEAGYDWKIIDRKRQNSTVAFIHSLGLSSFLNAFYPKDLFSRENLLGKNPDHAAPLLNEKDLFLLESFQVKDGAYEEVLEWQERVDQAIRYRAQYGSHIFATTTGRENQPFRPEQFAYAWWSAWLYNLDGFGWGEPNFSVPAGTLPDRQCALPGTMPKVARDRASINTDGVRFWRKVGTSLVVIDTEAHSIRLLSLADSAPGAVVELRVNSGERGKELACEEIR